MHRTNEKLENLLAKQRTKKDIRARTKKLNNSNSKPNDPRDPQFHRFTESDYRITGIRKLWRDWLAIHNIDPDSVDNHGWVHRDLTRCHIHYRSFVYHPTTHRMLVDREKYPPTPVTVTRTVRLESTPLEFPYAPIDKIIKDRAILEHAQADAQAQMLTDRLAEREQNQ